MIGFFTEVPYSKELIEDLYLSQRNIQGNPNYQVLKFKDGYSQLESLLKKFKIVKLNGVPECAMQYITNEIAKSETSTLPHQDALDFTNNDPRRWNMFRAFTKRDAKTYVINDSIMHKYLHFVSDFLLENPEMFGNINSASDFNTVTKSAIPITEEQFIRLRNGNYLKSALDGDKNALREFWILYTKLFKDNPKVEGFIDNILLNIDTYHPDELKVIEWDSPSEVYIFDNNSTYHGRWGPSNPELNPFGRCWIIDE